MKKVIIVCAGGFGFEAYTEICSINAEKEKMGIERPYHFLGFLSDVPVDLVALGIKEKIVGTIQDYIPAEDEWLFVGLSKPEQKKSVIDKLRAKGARFISIVSPYAYVGSDVIMGEGCLVTGGSVISCGARIGNFVNVNGSMISGGAEIGDYSTATGFTVIEDAIIGKGVFLGSKAVVKGGCRVGDWAQVYTGSVVIQDVKANTKVFGMPAQEI
jgi:acetyltransferase-like isoleucine patch superfamily enzyme